jgi:glycosyltransferase involved in cell wall biosynthesis
MHNSEAFVSVVTPVYNGEKYLAECIESVLAQTYSNWEYIILDNCSTDGTNEIARQYAQKDNRIRLYRNEELVDVITNHNKVYQKISMDSKYCKLLHADDWMFPDCLNAMISLAEQHPEVGIVGAYSLVGKRVRNDGLLYADKVLSGRVIARNSLLNQYYLFWSPSSLMMRSDLIRARDPFYNPEHLHADDDSLYILLQTCDFGFVHQVLTSIRDHEDSLTSMVTKPMNRTILSNLHLFAMHGPTYLTQDEFKGHLKNKMKVYYSFLATNALELRETKFWQYHQEWLDRFGFHFDRIELAKAIISKVINQPKQSIGKVSRALFNKWIHK